MAGLPRRRFIFGDPQMTADRTLELGTSMARVFYVCTLMPEVQQSQYFALLHVAYRADMMALLGEPNPVTYPEDVSLTIGCGQHSGARYLNELRRHHELVVGSAQAGYRLADRIAGGPLIVGSGKKSRDGG
jgi:hypothetical protein